MGPLEGHQVLRVKPLWVEVPLCRTKKTRILPSCYVRTQWEDGPYQTPHLLAPQSWPPSLQNLETFVYKPLSSWSSVTAAQMDRNTGIPGNGICRMLTTIPHWVCFYIHLELNNQHPYPLQSAFPTNGAITTSPPRLGFLPDSCSVFKNPCCFLNQDFKMYFLKIKAEKPPSILCTRVFLQLTWHALHCNTGELLPLGSIQKEPHCITTSPTTRSHILLQR